MNDVDVDSTKCQAKSAKHITIKGKPLCLCRLSDKQFAKMAELVGGRWTCTYDHDDPKLAVVVAALKQVVKDPASVEVHDGPHFGPPPLPPGMTVMTVPPEVAKKIMETIAGGPPQRGMLLPPPTIDLENPSNPPDSKDDEDGSKGGGISFST